jgi:mRNA-degrading endonuclease RelE of RelBE toxin-antitoxin system
MKIVETTVFSKRVNQLLTFEEYRELQNELIVDPEKGKVITGSGGLRKLRWSYSGKGKRGGVRVIYYWIRKDEIIMMLLIYSKNEQDNLTKEQLKILKTIVERELK